MLHRASGRIIVEPGCIDDYAGRGGLQMVPVILDGDVCVKLLRDVKQGGPLTFADVAFDANDIAVKARREMEAMFAP